MRGHRSLGETVRLVLAADFSADPVWRESGGGSARCMIPLERLAIPETLRLRLRAWARRHDELNDPPFWWGAQEDVDQWALDGHGLRAALQDALGPGYEVTYPRGPAIAEGADPPPP